MSNRICIQATKFTDISGREDRDESWGFRIYDDYDSEYYNVLTEQQARTVDPLAFLDIIIETLGNDQNHLQYVAETECGIDINDRWYEWEEIKSKFA